MDFELIELRYTIYRVIKEILLMKNDMKLIMESFNNWINEQTGAEKTEKLEKEIEALEKKIKTASGEQKAKLEEELAKKKAELEKHLDDVPPGGDNVLNPTKKDKEYEKEFKPKS